MTLAFYVQTNSTIEGVVRDSSTDAPLADVTIYLSNTGSTPLAFNSNQGRTSDFAVTDSQGHFTLETKETGRFRVYPSKTGYVYARPGQKHAPAEPGMWVQLSSGSHVKDLDLRMAKPGAISGRVLDANGNPIVGTRASVALMRYTYRDDGMRELGSVPGITYSGAAGSAVRPNDKGEFRLYDLPPGEYYLCVTGGGGAIGNSMSYCYPGVTDSIGAVPVAVSGGDDIKLGTLSLPSRPGVEVRLHNKGEPSPRGAQKFYIGDSMLIMIRPADPDEIVVNSVAPGLYDIVATSDTPADRNATKVYAFATLNVGANGLDQEIVMKPAARVSGTVLVEDDDGHRIPTPLALRCRIRSRYGLDNCIGSQVVPGFHQFDFLELPPDIYLQSAKIGDRDALAEGLNITGDTTLEVVLASPGAIVDGSVLTADGIVLSDAVVVLVPEVPYDKVFVRYRSVITDSNGKYEIHGVAPGSYKLYAWPELEGFAYRNPEFMKEFLNRGKAVRLEKKGRASMDLTALR